jgi:hypothetical protein
MQLACAIGFILQGGDSWDLLRENRVLHQPVQVKGDSDVQYRTQLQWRKAGLWLCVCGQEQGSRQRAVIWYTNPWNGALLLAKHQKTGAACANMAQAAEAEMCPVCGKKQMTTAPKLNELNPGQCVQQQGMRITIRVPCTSLRRDMGSEQPTSRRIPTNAQKKRQQTLTHGEMQEGFERKLRRNKREC